MDWSAALAFVAILSLAESTGVGVSPLLTRLYPQYDEPPLCPPGSNASPTGAGSVRIETSQDPIVSRLHTIGFRPIPVPGGTFYLASSPDLVFQSPPILVRPGKLSPIRPPSITVQPPQPSPLQPPAMVVKIPRPKPINPPPMRVKIPRPAPINLKPILVKIPQPAPIQQPPFIVRPKTPCPINPPQITVIPPCQPPIQPPVIKFTPSPLRNVPVRLANCN